MQTKKVTDNTHVVKEEGSPNVEESSVLEEGDELLDEIDALLEDQDTLVQFKQRGGQ